MSQKTIVFSFADKLFEFIKYLENVSNIPEISNLKTALNLAIKTGQVSMLSNILEQFMIQTQNYYKEIFEHNESFFLTVNITSFLPDNGEYTQDVTTFKDIWKNKLTTYEKEQVWSYMKTLMKLGASYYI